MGWSSVLLLLVITIISLLSYLILNLNSDIILVDLLFFDLEISLGMILLIFLLVGFIFSIILESVYFLRKRKRGDDSE